MTAPTPTPAPDYTRWVVFGLVLALVAGVVGYFWRVEYLTERCAHLGYQTVVQNPPPRPSELEWYREHCWDGAPR